MSTQTHAAQRRERAAAAREAARLAARRRRNRTRLAVLSSVLLAVLVVGVAIQAQRGSVDEGSGTPAGVVSGVAIPVGDAGAKVKVDVFEDFLCPACGAFERTTGRVIDELVEDGTVQVRYHVLAFLDPYSTTRYSSRSAAVAGCAQDAGVFPDLHRALYADQPAEGSAGLSDQKMIAMGRQSGGGDDFEACVKDGQYAGWVEAVTQDASKQGVNRTPTVRVAGMTLDNPTPEALSKAVAEAAA